MITLRDIDEAVSEVFMLQPREMHTKGRAVRLVRPRQIAMTLGVQMTTKGLKGNARYWDKDHTTILHATRAISRLCEASPAFLGFVDLCRERVAQKGSWMSLVRQDMVVNHVPKLAPIPSQSSVQTSRRLFVQTSTRRGRSGKEPYVKVFEESGLE